MYVFVDFPKGWRWRAEGLRFEVWDQAGQVQVLSGVIVAQLICHYVTGAMWGGLQPLPPPAHTCRLSPEGRPLRIPKKPGPAS